MRLKSNGADQNGKSTIYTVKNFGADPNQKVVPTNMPPNEPMVWCQWEPKAAWISRTSWWFGNLEPKYATKRTEGVVHGYKNQFWCETVGTRYWFMSHEPLTGSC